jgi:hypothetical protein
VQRTTNALSGSGCKGPAGASPTRISTPPAASPRPRTAWPISCLRPPGRRRGERR